MKLFKKLLLMEISVEIYACVYFLCNLTFYCTVQLVRGSQEANIWVMLQMIIVAYVGQYIYVIFGDIEKSGHFGWKEGITQLMIFSLYAVVSYYGNWFDKKLPVMLGFFVYLVIMYSAVNWVMYISRRNDTKMLNNLLDEFKKKGGNADE